MRFYNLFLRRDGVSKEKRSRDDEPSSLHGLSSREELERVRRDRESCAHLSSRTSAVHHPEDGSASVRAAEIRAHRPHRHLFTLTQYLLGRIGEAAVVAADYFGRDGARTAKHTGQRRSRSFSRGTHPLLLRD